MELIELSSGSLTVRILTLGAAIHSLDMPDLQGRLGNVHLTLASPQDYAVRALNPHLGSTIGRYANRIGGAAFEIDGSRVALVANNGPNQLHGGPDGWDRHEWTVVRHDPDDRGGELELALHSPDADQGFPGAVDATVLYSLEGDTLTISWSATTDAPTVVNMTNHGYWNLDGTSGPPPGSPTTVHDHHIVVASDRVLPVGPDGIPTGGLMAVDGTGFDLRRRRRLGAAMDMVGGGFDHCFEVRGSEGQASQVQRSEGVDGPPELRPAAVLDSPASGRWMEVSTDQPGVQLYTANGLGPPFGAHRSVSLETQAFPDTPNHPEFGSVELKPGQTYSACCRLRFGTGTPPSP